jgi:hypothetical protein
MTEVYIWKTDENRYELSAWERPSTGLAGESKRQVTLTKIDLSEIVDSQGDARRLNRLLEQFYRSSAD